MTWIAVAIAGSAVLGAGASMAAADKQVGAAGKASGIQAQQFQQTRSDLLPWQRAGNQALDQLNIGMGLEKTFDPAYYLKNNPDVAQVYGNAGIDPYEHYKQYGMREGRKGIDPNKTGKGNAGFGDLLKPFSLQDFKESPAYQFNLSEGLKAINKGASARGNFYAPKTLQDISKYTQGIADNEFNNAYGQYNNNQANVWNRLFALSGTGQSAANQTGAFGANAANNIAGNTIGAGNAQASGLVGASNALTGGAGQLSNQYMLSQILKGQQQSQYKNTAATDIAL